MEDNSPEEFGLQLPNNTPKPGEKAQVVTKYIPFDLEIKLPDYNAKLSPREDMTPIECWNLFTFYEEVLTNMKTFTGIQFMNRAKQLGILRHFQKIEKVFMDDPSLEPDFSSEDLNP